MYRFLRKAGSGFLLAMGAAVVAPGAAPAVYSLANPVPREQMRELNTDRPDQTEGPYTVDAGHFQVELDFLNSTRDRDTAGGQDVRRRDLSVLPVNLRLGLTSRVDLQLMVAPYESSRTEDRLAGTVARAAGFGDVVTRLKINFWGNDGGPTAFAVMPFIKWPLPASGVRNGRTEGGIIFPFTMKLPADWAAAMMTKVDFVRDDAGDRSTQWVNSVSFSHDLTKRLGGYLELFSVTGGGKGQGQFDVGLTYLVATDIQLDVGCNFGVTKSAPDYQPFVGVSRRF